VIATFHPIRDSTFQISQGIIEDRAAVFSFLNIQTSKAVFPWSKGLKKVPPQVPTFLQDIQDKFISSMHQRFNCPVFGNRDRQTWGIEACLGNPGG
jgi:hypothetical protein